MSLHTFKQHVPAYLAYFAAWLLLSALSIVLIFTCRDAVFVSAVWLQFNPWLVRALERFAIVLFGLIAFIYIMWLEYYLRQGRQRHQLWKHIVSAGKIPCCLLILSLGIKSMLS
jgi:hypothetical protein